MEAEKQLIELEQNNPCYRGRARELHAAAVIKYARENKPGARRANIRKVAHTGGTNPDATEHLTVSFKGGRNENGHGVHIAMAPPGFETANTKL